MGDARADRIAENEDGFRHLNEQLGVRGVFVCECGDATCREPIQMSREDYQSIRRNDRLFFVKPGHEKPDAETVIERGKDWYVVEKRPDVDHIVGSG